MQSFNSGAYTNFFVKIYGKYDSFKSHKNIDMLHNRMYNSKAYVYKLKFRFMPNIMKIKEVLYYEDDVSAEKETA